VARHHGLNVCISACLSGRACSGNFLSAGQGGKRKLYLRKKSALKAHPQHRGIPSDGPISAILLSTVYISHAVQEPLADWLVRGGIKRIYDRTAKGFVVGIDGGTATKMQLPKTSNKQCRSPCGAAWMSVKHYLRLIPLIVIAVGLLQRFLVLQVCFMSDKAFSVELTVTDEGKTRRRVHLTSAVHDWHATPLVSAAQSSGFTSRLLICNEPNITMMCHLQHVQVPLNEVAQRCGEWTNLVIDVHSIVRECFPSGVVKAGGVAISTIDAICIHPSAKIRKIFTLRGAPHECDSDTLGEDYPTEAIPSSQSFPIGVSCSNWLVRHGGRKSGSVVEGGPRMLKAATASGKKYISARGSARISPRPLLAFGSRVGSDGRAASAPMRSTTTQGSSCPTASREQRVEELAQSRVVLPRSSATGTAQQRGCNGSHSSHPLTEAEGNPVVCSARASSAPSSRQQMLAPGVLRQRAALREQNIVPAVESFAAVIGSGPRGTTDDDNLRSLSQRDGFLGYAASEASFGQHACFSEGDDQAYSIESYSSPDLSAHRASVGNLCQTAVFGCSGLLSPGGPQESLEEAVREECFEEGEAEGTMGDNVNEAQENEKLELRVESPFIEKDGEKCSPPRALELDSHEDRDDAHQMTQAPFASTSSVPNSSTPLGEVTCQNIESTSPGVPQRSFWQSASFTNFKAVTLEPAGNVWSASLPRLKMAETNALREPLQYQEFVLDEVESLSSVSSTAYLCCNFQRTIPQIVSIPSCVILRTKVNSALLSLAKARFG
jgi:hypothetical protein